MKTRLVLAMFVVLSIGHAACIKAVGAQTAHLNVGWSEDFNEPERWQEDLSLLRRPAARRSFLVQHAYGEFRVSDSGREARWTETTEPIWASDYRYFVMRYRAQRVNPHAGAVVALRPGSVGPVTPGASNPENPFAKGANLVAVRADELVQDGVWHLFVKDLSPQLQTAQIDQVIVTVDAGTGGDARLEIEYVRFVNSDPRHTLADFLPIEPAGSLSCSLPNCSQAAFFAADLHSMVLTSAAKVLPVLGIKVPWLGARSFTFAGLPFANGGVATTSVEGRETLSISIGKRASEIYFLLGTSFTGIGDTVSALEVSGVDSGKGLIQALREPERFDVAVEYSDGAVDQCFPFNLLRQAFVMENHSLGLYLVTADSSRPIARLKLRDHMSNGAFFLFGTTLNLQRPLFPGVQWTGASPPNVPAANSLPARSVEATRAPDGLVMENAIYRYEFSAAKTFRLLHVLNKFSGTDMLGDPQRGSLFSCGVSSFARGLPVTKTFYMDDFDLASLAVAGDRVTASLVAPDSTLPLKVQLTLTADDSSTLDAGLTLENAGPTPLHVDLTFPELRDVRLGETDDTYYLFPRGAAVLSNADQKLEATYSDNAPLQFLDVFNPRQNAGWGLLVKDISLRAKVFSLNKQGERATLAVSYSYPVEGPGNYRQAILLAPGERFEAPSAGLLVHWGDWRPAFRAYRDWVKTWYHPLPRKDWFANVFSVRRDYPIGGTGKLFDMAANHYTIEKLITEGQEIGGADMIDISGWAYSPRYGRVGDYCHFTLGGLDDLKQSIARSQSQGVPVGLYTEGYLDDLNSLIGEQYGREWQMVDRQGTPRAWAGAGSEVFECPYAKGWQDYMSATAARVVSETGAKAFYLDEYGFSPPEQACYSTVHGHAPGATPAAGEREMMIAVRHSMDTVDPMSALYIEEMPPRPQRPIC